MIQHTIIGALLMGRDSLMPRATRSPGPLPSPDTQTRGSGVCEVGSSHTVTYIMLASTHHVSVFVEWRDFVTNFKFPSVLIVRFAPVLTEADAARTLHVRRTRHTGAVQTGVQLVRDSRRVTPCVVRAPFCSQTFFYPRKVEAFIPPRGLKCPSWEQNRQSYLNSIQSVARLN